MSRMLQTTKHAVHQRQLLITFLSVQQYHVNEDKMSYVDKGLRPIQWLRTWHGSCMSSGSLTVTVVCLVLSRIGDWSNTWLKVYTIDYI